MCPIHSTACAAGKSWILPSLLVLACTADTPAQTDFQRLRSFGNPEQSAAIPYSTLIQGTNGMLYGTTYEGGGRNLGTVFRMNTNGNDFAVLHSFVGGSDGGNPQAGLLEASDGVLYGTSYGSGTNDGTVFRLRLDGSDYEVLRAFPGGGVYAGLVEGTNGVLYGTTGGTNVNGSVFKLNKDGSGYTVLHAMNGSAGNLFVATDGMLYGTTYRGGLGGRGAVFRLDHEGGEFTNLYSFTGSSGDGSHPLAGVVEGTNGMLYGTTYSGGSSNFGAVFRLGKDGSSYSVIHSFDGSNADGWYPMAGLTSDGDGMLYGTTFQSGGTNRGTVFKISEEGDHSVLRYFAWAGGKAHSPRAGLLASSDGMLYGTGSKGGLGDDGAVFKMDRAGSNYVVLFSFSWSGQDGYTPEAELLEASDAILYGTTRNGGSSDYGTVFKQNKDGSGYAVLHSFTWTPDGGCPQAGLVEGSGGVLYGTTYGGGAMQFGTVFKMNKDGSDYSVLHSFAYDDGAFPQASLLKGTNGVLYGTASGGGRSGYGAIFTITESGDFAVLRHLENSGAGVNPASRLVSASDGMLYGTSSGGALIFKVGYDGSGFAVLSSFSVGGFGTAGPSASLIEGTDGSFYGTTFGGTGGPSGFGTVYRTNKDGTNGVVHSFLSFGARNPLAGLTEAGGVLYGTTSSGRNLNAPFATNWGTVFRLNNDGSDYSILFSFTNDNAGRSPVASLLKASDDALYGTAPAGGDLGGGTIFSLAYLPSLVGIEVGAAGALLRFTGDASRAYGVQATTNISAPIWQTLALNVTSTSNVFHYLDAQAAGQSGRYYRIQSR